MTKTIKKVKSPRTSPRKTKGGLTLPKYKTSRASPRTSPKTSPKKIKVLRQRGG